MNRESWLTALLHLLRAHLEVLGYRLPPAIYASVGWTAFRASRITKRRGECRTAQFAPDGSAHIFVSPILTNAYDVAAVVIHELLHIAVGVEHGHGPVFMDAFRAAGLKGPPTSTVPGEQLGELIRGLLTTLPPWPHTGLVEVAPAVRPGSRMIRLTCICGYYVRTTRKQIALGLPFCPFHHPLQEKPH